MENIPEEFKDKPELYFAHLEEQQNKARIEKLQTKITILEEQIEKYRFALFEILLIVEPSESRFTGPRIGPIRKVLKQFERDITLPSLDALDTKGAE